MDNVQELVESLKAHIDECDELIVEISQLRYHLEDIIAIAESQIKHSPKSAA